MGPLDLRHYRLVSHQGLGSETPQCSAWRGAPSEVKWTIAIPPISTRFRSGESFRTIDPPATRPRHWTGMARYSGFLGRRVEVHYRAGDVLLPASGTFVADSGRSIFLEQSLVQRGQQRHFRWEIPYQYIVRLEEKTEDGEGGDSRSGKAPAVKSIPEPTNEVSRAVASASGGGAALLPLPNRPKTA